MADDGCEVRSGECGDGESGQPTPQAHSEDGVASGEWRVKSEWPVASGQWSVASESGVSREPTQEEWPATQNVQNEANPESTQSSLALEVESSVPDPAGRKRSQREGANAPRSTLHAPRSTLHASPVQWPVNLERVVSRRKRSAGRRKMCKTKPIRNQRKALCRLVLSRPCPSLRVENEAKGRELTLHAPRLTPTVASEWETGETAVIKNRQDRRQLFSDIEG